MIDVRRTTSAYLLEDDGEVVGELRFREAPDAAGSVLVLVHTQVDPTHEGEHLGTRLVRDALADIRSRGERIVPRCPFVVGYLERHPQDRDLVALSR